MNKEQSSGEGAGNSEAMILSLMQKKDELGDLIRILEAGKSGPADEGELDRVRKELHDVAEELSFLESLK